jgi:hypothetical protein
MTGFRNFDRFDRWILTTVIIFMVTTIWLATHAPASMSVTTMLLAALGSGMLASGRLIWRALPKPPRRLSFFPPTEPLRVLTSMSTMARFEFDTIASRCGNNKQAMLSEFRSIYKSDGMNSVTHFTVDRRDRAYDPIGAYKTVDGVSPACEVPAGRSDMINIFWYVEQPTVRINGNTGELCHHTNPEYCRYCRCYEVSKHDRIKVTAPVASPTPAVVPPLPKAKLIHRGGLGSSAIHHGISKRSRIVVGIDPGGKDRTGVAIFYDNKVNFVGISHLPEKTVDDVIDQLFDQDVSGMWLSDLIAACATAGIPKIDALKWLRANDGCATLTQQTVGGPSKIWIQF